MYLYEIPLKLISINKVAGSVIVSATTDRNGEIKLLELIKTPGMLPNDISFSGMRYEIRTDNYMLEIFVVDE